jgi:hypothetical protein
MAMAASIVLSTMEGAKRRRGIDVGQRANSPRLRAAKLIDSISLMF